MTSLAYGAFGGFFPSASPGKEYRRVAAVISIFLDGAWLSARLLWRTLPFVTEAEVDLASGGVVPW